MSNPNRPGVHRRRFSRKAKTACGSVTALAVGGMALLAPTSAHARSVGATFSKSTAWDTGYTGTYEISNGTGEVHSGWKLEFDLPVGVSVQSLWNGKYKVDGRHVVVTPESWTEKIQPGQKVTIGFTTSHSQGAGGDPADCLIDGATCSPGAPPSGTPSGTPSPSGSPSTDPNPTSPPSTPPPGPGAAASFAPYVDTSLYPAFDLSATGKAAGIKEFNLAFVVSPNGANDTCTPKWGGITDLGQDKVAAQIGAFRENGGDVRVSFGGANGKELGQACAPELLAGAYQQVIDAYNLTKVDFDVEGGAVADQAANTRRAQAIAQLQKNAAAKGKKLDVSFTLPVMPEGLTHHGQELLKNAKTNGVKDATVNIMAMDYGPGYTGNMGDYAISAATATQNTVKNIFGLGDTQAWKKIAVTPMIGQNDVQGEIFTTADAKKLVGFAKQKKLGWLSMWSGARDKQCPQGTTSQAAPTCSSVLQQPLEFSKEFAKYTG